MSIPSPGDMQNLLGIILAVPGLAVILLILLVYFGFKAIYALFETVEEIMVE